MRAERGLKLPVRFSLCHKHNLLFVYNILCLKEICGLVFFAVGCICVMYQQPIRLLVSNGYTDPTLGTIYSA